MTIGQIVESLFGKVCASYGAFGDCTAFQVKGSNYSTYAPMLVDQGFHSSGNQLLYNGMTGEQLEANIYIGPTYYMRLKHMVKDKINYRARGPNTVLTRQPVQGRANDGGLRIGEMERDGVLGHGMSYFLNESFMVRGDEFYIAVCNKTGAVAIYNESKNLFLSPYADGPINFVTNPDGSQNIKNLSKFGRSFSILRVPYSLKLLIQELQVMNVQMRIITDDNVDQLLSMSYSDNINKLLQVGDKDLKDVTKEYSQQINSIIYKDNQTAKRIVINDEPYVLPEVVNLTSEEQELPQVLPESMPEVNPNISPPAYSSPAYPPGTPQAYSSPPYAPETPPYTGGMPQPIIDSSSQDKFIINPNILEPKPNILDIETPVETERQEEIKEENNDENNSVSETKKIAISQDITPPSSSDDSKKIIF
jgi:hypothetical protein